jgi:hypothetical protein
MTRTHLSFVFIAVAAACGPTAPRHGSSDGGAGGGDAALHTLQSITVTPTNPIVQLNLNATGAQGFSASGSYADGTTEDVTAMASWTVANPAVGTMTGATLNIPAFATATAQTSLITAGFHGVTGQAQITVVAYRLSQDFFFVLPYQDPGGNVTKPLDFSTAVPSLDVYFNMDTTGSMGGEIANLQSSLNSTIVPGIQAVLPNTQFGVGAFEDFPISPYGDASGTPDGTADQPFKLKQVITSSISMVTAGVNALSVSGSPIGIGGDGPEAALESIYQAATGAGLTGPAPTNVPANHTGVGGVGFRTGTMPVIVTISDANTHGVGEPTTSCGTMAYAAPVSAVAHSRAQVKSALSTICARSVGIAAIIEDACSAQSYMEDLAASTGTRVPPSAWDVGTRPAGCAATQCCTDYNGVGRATDADGLCPLVFRVHTDGTGVSASVVTGIQMLTRFATFDVTHDQQGVATDIAGNPLPSPRTTADFIKAVTPQSFMLPPPPPVLPTPTLDANAFHNVTPGTQVTFGLSAYNDFVPQTDRAQIFRATVRVLAGGCTPLDQRDVIILVPAMPIVF